MYELVGVLVVSHLATQKSEESGGDWVIDDKKDPGIFNDYRSVGAGAALLVTSMTPNKDAGKVAAIAAVGLGASYLFDKVWGKGDEKKLGPSLTPGKTTTTPTIGMTIIGFNKKGEPVFGADTSSQQQLSQNFAGQPVFNQPATYAGNAGMAPWQQNFGQAPLSAPFS